MELRKRSLFSAVGNQHFIDAALKGRQDVLTIHRADNIRVSFHACKYMTNQNRNICNHHENIFIYFHILRSRK